MCLSCGCGEPHDNHGDDRHITLEMLQAAAAAAARRRSPPTKLPTTSWKRCTPTTPTSEAQGRELD